jgi:ubiquinone/menaquinone biosynthesis C-methylase UbiE
MKATEEAWSDFWQSGARPVGGCLPNALRTIDAVQRALWTEIVRPLRKGASVLDLATGDGAVLVKMRAVRPDLKLVGVDSAAGLPDAPPGIRLKPNVRMEQLPFPDQRFDLVSSQFGIEYGELAVAVSEVARVLRPRGAFAFLVHHADGPIVTHNRTRSAALAWIVRDSLLLERARGYVRLRSGGRMPVPQSFSDAVAEAQARFPDQGVAAEFAEAVRRTLAFSLGEPPERTLAAVRELEMRADNELARVDTLMLAARDAHGISQLAELLRSASLQVAAPVTVSTGGGGTPFGWLLRGGKH